MSRETRIGSRVFAVGAVACALAAVGAAQASAVTRYAAPGANGPIGSCTSANPLAVKCSIVAIAGPGVAPTDTAVILPGNYTDADLGGSGFSMGAGDIHGVAGQPRPVLNLSSNTVNPAFVVNGTVSHLEINNTGPRQSLFSMDQADEVVEDVIARSSYANGTTCKITEGLLRNSVCMANTGTAVGTGATGQTVTLDAQQVNLRGVTAIASGASSAARGLEFVTETTRQTVVYARGVIARAPSGKDIGVVQHGSGQTSIDIDYSNYATTDNSFGGSINDQGNQQTVAPSFAADGYHQLPTSASTINVGAVNALSGDYDIDGQYRSINAPDIGADELGRSTGTAITCVPASVVLLTSSDCNVVVTDTGVGSGGGPSGPVAFSTDAPGNFSGGGQCTLNPIGIGSSQGECTITYTPTVLATGTHQINTVFGPDLLHEGSQGQVDLGVTPIPPDTDGDGVPDASDACPSVAAATVDGCPPPPVAVTPTGATPGATPGATTGAARCRKGQKLKKFKGKKKKRCVKKKKKRR